MSSSVAATQIVNIADEVQQDNYAYFATLALLIYDYLLTFDCEVGSFWAIPSRVPSVLFYVTRYQALLSAVSQFGVWIPTLTDKVLPLRLLRPSTVLIPRAASGSCDELVNATDAFSNVRYLSLAAFSAMRAYALARHRKWAVCTLVSVLSLIPLVVNCMKFKIGIHGFMFPPEGCLSDSPTTQVEAIMCVPSRSLRTMSVGRNADARAVTILSRGGFILSDFILAVLTWRTQADSVRFDHKMFSADSLASVMMWNGMLYLIAAVTLNVLHIVFSLTAIWWDGAVSHISTFTDPLMAILVTRFLLDLQEANQRDVKLDSDDPLHFTESEGRRSGSLNFARVAGSIAATIRPGSVEREEATAYEADGIPDLPVAAGPCGSPQDPEHAHGHADDIQEETRGSGGIGNGSMGREAELGVK
ncbi:hypothetical protein C8T65DRAFT_832088 [Cerioporus squamosus]|nr:hypothetical protein C8T65DRAFT_832088 [Cerioporus squamosus]